MGKEIERKFIIREVPQNYTPIKVLEIVQQYLNSEGVNSEVRIRSTVDVKNHKGPWFFITEKSLGNLVRDEYEKEITEGMFESIYQLIKDAEPIRKKRLIFNIEGYEVTIDKYEKPNNLIIAEVEFSDEEQAIRYHPPTWFGDEITNKRNFKNFNIWKSLNNHMGPLVT